MTSPTKKTDGFGKSSDNELSDILGKAAADHMEANGSGPDLPVHHLSLDLSVYNSNDGLKTRVRHARPGEGNMSMEVTFAPRSPPPIFDMLADTHKKIEAALNKRQIKADFVE